MTTTTTEDGSATVLTVGAMGVLAGIVLILAAFAGVFHTYHRASSAADFAALAAAQTQWDPLAVGDPCAVAADIAAANGAELSSCVMQGDHVVVETRATGSLLGRPMTMRARAMAGPDSSSP